MRSAKGPRSTRSEPHTWQDELRCPGIVISCQASISRNIAGHAFPDTLTLEQRRSLRDDFFARLGERRPGTWHCIRAENRDAWHDYASQGLCPPGLAGLDGAGLAIRSATPGETVTLLVNENDHLRFRAEAYGCDLRKLYDMVSACESDLDGAVADYAFDPTFGYLTADPAHLGTGLHLGVRLHLAGLHLVGDLEKAFHALERLGMVVREADRDEDSPTHASVYDVFNAQTLGEDEQGILERTNEILRDLAVQEDWARQRLLESDIDTLADFLGRSYGIAMNARRLTAMEANELNRALYLGFDTGLFDLRRGAALTMLPWIHDFDVMLPEIRTDADLARARAAMIRSLYASVRLRF